MWNNLYWRLFIIRLAFKRVWIINLGDLVWYKGNKYMVLNGVRPNSWRLSDLDNDDEGWVPRNECKKVWTFSNMKHSFHFSYNFYMTSWYDIWCRDGVKPWVKGLNIWGKRR